MLVDLDQWKPGEDVDDDSLVLGELRKSRAEDFTRDQKARVAALKASREVLSEKNGGAFSSTTKAVDTMDLVSVAGWIIDGKDPWAPKENRLVRLEPGQDVGMLKENIEYPNGRCDLCGFGLNDSNECTNPDCRHNT